MDVSTPSGLAGFCCAFYPRVLPGDIQGWTPLGSFLHNHFFSDLRGNKSLIRFCDPCETFESFAVKKYTSRSDVEEAV